MKFRRTGKIIAVQAIILLALAASAANTRLAIGTLGLSQDNQDEVLADLVANNLSGESGVELVERRELDAVLKEASLSRSGLVRAKDAVRVGALLRADQFLLGGAFRLNGTNNLMVRLVDARTGAIRAISVFGESSKLQPMADVIAAFVRAEVLRPATEHRDYLAIGVVQNLGVNNRFADFPVQMRAYLAAHLGEQVTVLERDVVSFLANEVRLDLAGLTDQKGGPAPQMQFGFWIVDGFYQSYEVAEPEVQLRLRIERVLGGQTLATLQGKPDDGFFHQIRDAIVESLNRPLADQAAPTRLGEIEALEARGRQLIDYRPAGLMCPASVRPRAAFNPDRITNTVTEATRVYESILLLDPQNNAAKMRLAACLIYDPNSTVVLNDVNPKPGADRSQELYREVIATGDRAYADDARLSLACSYRGFKGMELLRRFEHESSDRAAQAEFRMYRQRMLELLSHQTPYAITIEQLMPYYRQELLDQLADIREHPRDDVDICFDSVLFAYRFRPPDRERITNELLPELLQAFPELEPYLLLTAAGEQVSTNSPVTAQFLASLKRCEEHPETVFQPKSYFTHLSSTLEEEKAVGRAGVCTQYQRTFDNRQYATIIAMALARQQAVAKGLAPPLTALGKRRLGESYLELERWKEALEVFDALADVPPELKNRCRAHLHLAAESEEPPAAAWTNLTDIAKVELAYDCMGKKQWGTALAILESMGRRTVRMNSGGAWGYAFTPVLPAVVADECRVKAGRPKLVDPARFELGEMPYVRFMPPGPRFFAFQAVGDDLWLATYSQIKRFSGPGPFLATNACELHEFQRTTQTPATAIYVGRDYVWAGTADDGLIELDRRTGSCRRFTMADGLLVNGICYLYLDSQTLWIGYGHGENGAMGTMDIAAHKFSAFTPNLPAGAETNSQPYWNQPRLENRQAAPQRPVIAMAPLDNQLCFAVESKGLQLFRNSDRTWTTIGDPEHGTNNPIYMKTTPTGRRQWGWLPLMGWPSTRFSALASDVKQGLLLVAMHESLQDIGHNERSEFGGLILFDYRKNEAEWLRNGDGLPSNEVTALDMAGNVAWVGGRGFVAFVDLPSRQVVRLAFVSASRVQKIQLGSRFAWIQISCGVDFYPDAGNARTGVYRIERTTVEPATKMAASPMPERL